MKTATATIVIILLSTQIVIPLLMSRSPVYFSVNVLSVFGESQIMLCENYLKPYDAQAGKVRGTITRHCTDGNSVLHDAWLAIVN